MLEDCPHGTLVAFTDGSCLPNPGPCGAGSCIFPTDNDQTIQLKRPVSHYGSILLAELVAVLMTLEYIWENEKMTSAKSIQIFSDSQSTIGLLMLGWKPNQYQNTIQRTMKYIHDFENRGTTVKLDWSPGHASIHGNELADKLAKEAAQEAKGLDDSSIIITQNDIKAAARKLTSAKWQRQWDKSEAGRRMFHFKPKVAERSTYDKPRDIYSKIVQLRSGYCRLNKYLKQIGVEDNELCMGCNEAETPAHFLLYCCKYETEREHLRRAIFNICGELTLTEELLLGEGSTDEFKQYRPDINEQLGVFLTVSGRI